MTRWTPLLMDEASLSVMPKLPIGEIMSHSHVVAAQQPKPRDLYRRWERQQWSAEAIPLEKDRKNLAKRLPTGFRQTIEESIAAFIIGEYTAVEMLGPIITGSPDEEYSLFLGTQIADETRHTHLVFRLGEEVLGLDADRGRMLRQSWERTAPAHQELSLLEAGLVHDLHRRPLDYDKWLRAVTLFHLVTEGILALVGQRILVQALRNISLLDGIKTAFTAMCRDESRHVGFGIHALRTGIQEGYHDDICEVLEQAVPIALRVDSDSNTSMVGADLNQMNIDILRRHMNGIGIDQRFQEKLLTSADPHAGTAKQDTLAGS